MKLTLCCQFIEQPIKFTTYKLKSLLEMDEHKAREKILMVIDNNIKNLELAINYCLDKKIESFRISSNMIPHFDNIIKFGFIDRTDLDQIEKKLKNIQYKDLILSMHPGQYVNMGSPTKEVVENSVLDLRYHIFIAKAMNFDDINIHIGGAYGDKEAAKERFIKNMKMMLTNEELKMITIENDEYNYSIDDVIDVVNRLEIRATFDIHHQRVYNLRYGIEDNIEDQYFRAKKTWKDFSYNRIHISSPKFGYEDPKKARNHSDYIDIMDIPFWLMEEKDLVCDVEAKMKELAVLKLYNELNK